MTEQTKCGFITIIGPPNAGKSTLVNALAGQKVSIVSPKKQTTRTSVTGIVVKDESQIIFVDTPGIFQAKTRLERAIVKKAEETILEADGILALADVSSSKSLEALKNILQALPQKKPPLFLVLNKIDQSTHARLLEVSKEFNALFQPEAIFMISALNKDGLDGLMQDITRSLPEEPWHYPEEQLSDMPSRLLAAEITREKAFHFLHQELPYHLTVETESWEAFDNGSIKISQVIFASRESHKAMILGKKGQMIKKIGEESRKELQEIFECQIHLKLFVKIDQKWLDDPERYRAWGLDHKA